MRLSKSQENFRKFLSIENHFPKSYACVSDFTSWVNSMFDWSDNVGAFFVYACVRGYNKRAEISRFPKSIPHHYEFCLLKFWVLTDRFNTIHWF